jgi:hypothetical protein
MRKRIIVCTIQANAIAGWGWRANAHRPLRLLIC